MLKGTFSSFLYVTHLEILILKIDVSSRLRQHSHILL